MGHPCYFGGSVSGREAPRNPEGLPRLPNRPQNRDDQTINKNVFRNPQSGVPSLSRLYLHWNRHFKRTDIDLTAPSHTEGRIDARHRANKTRSPFPGAPTWRGDGHRPPAFSKSQRFRLINVQIATSQSRRLQKINIATESPLNIFENQRRNRNWNHLC